MNKILLTTSPRFDDATEYLSYYTSLILKECKNKIVQCKNFEGKDLNLEEVSKFISKQNPKLLFVNGHGDEENLYGYKEEILFSMQEVNLLKNRIIYARACDAGIKLGKEIVKNNNGTFIGYLQPFSFWFNPQWATNPAKDKIAKLYLEPSNEIIVSLLKGKSTSESNEKSKKFMIDNMKKILVMEEKKEEGAMNMLQALWNNYEGQILLGNKENFF